MAIVAMMKVGKYKQRLDRHREDIDTLNPNVVNIDTRIILQEPTIHLIELHQIQIIRH